MRWFLLVWLMFVMVQVAEAAKVYTWKDSSGVVHFVDAEYKVPKAFRKVGGRELSELPKVSQRKSQRRVLNGQALYNRECSKCHVTTHKSVGKREGLGSVVVDSATKFVRSPDELFTRLRRDIEGEGGMSSVVVTDEELMAIAKYLIKVESSK